MSHIPSSDWGNDLSGCFYADQQTKYARKSHGRDSLLVLKKIVKSFIIF